MIHGDKDRATSHLATKGFFERIASTDKELKIYEGYEHVMTKVSRLAKHSAGPTTTDPAIMSVQVGIDEEDDAKRQAVLQDWVGWMCKRATIEREKVTGETDGSV